jgi:hypothetical protein
MKWMRERDLLIAQTMAFVQSVTGKIPEAETTIATSVATRAIDTFESTRSATPESTRAATPLPAATPLRDIEALLAQTMPPVRAPVETPRETSRETPGEISREGPREISRPAALVRPDLREDFQAEIRARVATFRAHQERFTREREAYCAATMAKVHAALRDGEQPTRPIK